RGDPALADARPLHDPLVRRVDQLREVIVRDHALGRVRTETRDRDGDAGVADHALSLPTKTVSIASAATSPSTAARPCPFAIRRRTRRNSHSSSSTSPGSTTLLNRQSSIPAKNGILPSFASCASTATAPHWAIASIVSTPGITGRSGKWPWNHQPSS